MWLTNREIHHAVLSMAGDRVLSTDMVEQMCKYTPVPEEIQALQALQDQVGDCLLCVHACACSFDRACPYNFLDQ